MTEEEKKAIELLEKVRDNTWTSLYIMSSDSKNAETLLNLVKKQQEEIENLKWKNEIYVKSIKSHKNEIEKRNKIINEMANYISILDTDEDICKNIKQPCNDYAGENKMTCDECIKQYFENKVEGSK